MIAFSQTGIKNTITNKDSVVALPKNVAIAVAKDIIRKDSLTSEVESLKKTQKLLELNSAIKDSIINTKQNIILLHQEKEKNYNTMLDYKDLQKKNLEDLTTTLNKELKKTKRQLKFTKIGGVLIMGVFSYLILK